MIRKKIQMTVYVRPIWYFWALNICHKVSLVGGWRGFALVFKTNWYFFFIEGCDLEQDDPSVLDEINPEELLSPIVRMEKYMHSDVIFNR